MRKRKHERRLEDNLAPSNLPSTPCHPLHCVGASQVEEIPFGSSKSRLFFQDIFPGTHLLCRGGRPAASLAVLGSPRLFLKNPYSWTEKPRACISSCLMFPTCQQESELKETESCAHQIGSSILALLKATRTDVDMSSNGPVKPGLLLAMGGMGQSSTALLTQPEEPYESRIERSTHSLTSLLKTWLYLDCTVDT